MTHKLSLTTAILININIMVGSGILIGPAVMAGISGNASFLAWLLGALLLLPVVLCTVQLSRMCPGAGGFYAYAKEGLGKTAGFWSGMLYITGYTFSIAVETLALLQKALLPTLGENWLTTNPALFNALFLGGCALLNILSLKFLTKVLNSLTIFKLIPLIALILLIPFIFKTGFTITPSEWSMLPYSLSFALFGYLGFESCCAISHHIVNSERNAPLAILIAFFATAVVYALFHFGLLNLMGKQALTELGAPSFAQFITLPIPYLKSLLSFIIPIASCITLVAATNALLNANAVMIHSMAQEKLFWGSEFLSKMTSWYRPWVTICLQAVASFLLATFLPKLNIVGNLANAGVFLSFVLPFVSLFIIQQRKGLLGKMVLTVAGICVTIALSLYCLYSLADTFNERLLFMTPFIACLALGATLYRQTSSNP